MESELLNVTSKCLIEASEDEVLCVKVFERREMERREEIYISTLLFSPTSLCPYLSDNQPNRKSRNEEWEKALELTATPEYW